MASPDESTTAESLLRDADTAMYQAKEAGRDAVAIFDVEMRDRTARRARLERDLHTALEHNELVLHYQPVVDLDPVDVVGFEALLRWNHPHLGTVPPLDFISIAEDTGLIVPIGAWVLETACRQLAAWKRELPGGRDLRMAVNLSARQLREPGLVDTVIHAAARATSSTPDRVILELTESLLMDQNPGARDTLRALARARLPHLDRRLRHRLLVARVPADVPGRRGQDRQVVRRRPRPSRHAARSRSSPRSWRWPTRSACRPRPKGSRPRARPSGSRRSRSTRRRVTCSPGRPRPRRCPAWSRGCVSSGPRLGPVVTESA